VSGPNDALAAVLDSGDTDALLAALVDGGVHVPVSAEGSVVFIGVDDSGPVVPGYTSEASRARLLPEAAGSVHCDALRLIDIWRRTGVETLAVFGERQWVKVPLPLVATKLRRRETVTDSDQNVRLTRSADPAAVALRGAVADRILAHPQVQAVWIAHVRWQESGTEQLMVHMAVDAGANAAANELMEAALAESRPTAEFALRVLEPHEAEQAAQLDTMGLDTVRADHAAGRVHVISQEFD
jgi:hypothetical protein